jgi:hypothetical protein
MAQEDFQHEREKISKNSEVERMIASDARLK